MSPNRRAEFVSEKEEVQQQEELESESEDDKEADEEFQPQQKPQPRSVLSHIEIPAITKRQREEYGPPKDERDLKMRRAMIAANLACLGIDLDEDEQVECAFSAMQLALTAKEEVPIPESY
jgi:hypothetical protein